MPKLSLRACLIFLCLLTYFSLPACAQDQEAGFANWKANFLKLAKQEGISNATLRAADAYIVQDPKVITYDQRQPEKTQSFTDYLEATVTPSRVQRAREEYNANKALLDDIEAKYQVPGEVVIAIWALESNFGERQGNYNTLTSLATLAYEGRRRDLFESELIAALRILENYHLKPAELQGSWAGAMGECQFMPSSLLKYGVDADGDGRADIWHSTPDSLSSIANYLQQNGWDKSLGISQKVKIPDDLDEDLAKEKLAKPLTEWHALGVVRPTGAALYLSGAPARLVLPGGTSDQAFLVYDNFEVLLQWNRSTYFALAIADLAGRINPKLKNVKP